MAGSAAAVPPWVAGSTAGFAVIAHTSWHALRAVSAVQVDWQPRPCGALDTAAIERSLENAVKGGKGHVFHETGNVERAENGAARTVEAWYRASYLALYLAHMTLEPMNCTAQVAHGKVVVWAPTQVPSMARDCRPR